jgi:hypothetical protein
MKPLNEPFQPSRRKDEATCSSASRTIQPGLRIISSEEKVQRSTRTAGSSGSQAGPPLLPKKHRRINHDPVEPQEEAVCRPRAAETPRQETARLEIPEETSGRSIPCHYGSRRARLRCTSEEVRHGLAAGLPRPIATIDPLLPRGVEGRSLIAKGWSLTSAGYRPPEEGLIMREKADLALDRWFPHPLSPKRMVLK